jgi:hypothetical protein
MILEKILMPKVKKACLTYDNSFLCDGAGAQIQRIAAIYGIAMKYRCMFAKTEILDIDSKILSQIIKLSKINDFKCKNGLR